MSSEAEIEQEDDSVSMADFFERTPAGALKSVSDLVETVRYESTPWYEIHTPEIQLHCSNDRCNGIRIFRKSKRPERIDIPRGTFQYAFVSYTCSNCSITRKDYALAVTRKEGDTGQAYKFGEIPEYGPSTPSRLIKLIGPDRDYFLKGRRCENQGLGVGAFVYYRRVIENQKNRILDEILKVSRKIGASQEIVDKLNSAKAETQFTKAIEQIKPAVPQALLINGHNPLTLLHSALSEGLHLMTDEACLEVAASIRIVLAELSDRLGQALKDEAELNHAVSKLLQVKS